LLPGAWPKYSPVRRIGEIGHFVFLLEKPLPAPFEHLIGLTLGPVA
jgi:hypothetical protein